MVLLKGLNYDYANQQQTVLSNVLGANDTSMDVESTVGFSANDYLVIDPLTSVGEIVKISAVTNDKKLTLSAAPKFEHAASAKIYRLPWNQMRFYYAASYDGTYTLITTVDMTYDRAETNYSYAAGTSEQYFKRTFYNSTSAVESDIGVADYWQTSDEYTHVTTEELRAYLQFESDYLSEPEMLKLIQLSQRRLNLDLDSSDPDIVKLSALMCAKVFVMNALAAKAVGPGFITMNAEGRTVTRAYNELKKEAEKSLDEYLIFLKNNAQTFATKTNFFDDATIIDPDTRTEIVDRFTGTQNVMDYEGRFEYGFRKRRT